jgi:CRP/FNR family cyclic AMP-dependent transcriptional regulator
MGVGATREQQLEHLHAIPEFSTCTLEQLEEVIELCDQLLVQAGEVILKEGRIGRELFIVLSGTAAVTRRGKEVALLGPGNYFGELGAIDHGPRNATVTAVTDLDVLIIGSKEFESMASIAGFRDAILKGMTRRIREADAATTGGDLGEGEEGSAKIYPLRRAGC